MSVRSRIMAYYDALREGDPLFPYFAPDEGTVKFGISETLAGYEAIEAGLQRQTATTTDWTVESHDLRVTERDRHAWFADRVTLAWTALDDRDESASDDDREESMAADGTRHEFETRWSGTLERRPRDAPGSQAGDWRFVGMHVSTTGEL